MRRYGLYLPGALDSSVVSFFQAHKPKMNAIQIYFNGPQRFYPASRYAEEANVRKIRAFTKAFDVRAHIHAPYVITIVNQPEKSAECVKRHLDYCDLLGLDHIVVHSGSWEPNLLGIDPVTEWVKFLEPFQQHKATVLLENMAYAKGMTAHQLNEVCRRVKCGVCLDTVHAWVSQIMNVDELEPQYVKLIHLNQTKAGRGSGKDSHSENHLTDGVIGMGWLRSTVDRYAEADLISEYALDEWGKELEQIAKFLED